MSVRHASQRRPWVSVATSVAGAGVVLGLLIALLGDDRATWAIRRVFAVATSALLNALGNATVVRDADILSNSFGISVVTACTGLFVTGLFLAAVAAFPVSWRAKLAGAGIGLAALFAVNVVRLASLYYVGMYWRSALEPIHQLVWQSLVIAFAVSLWLLWAGRVSKPSGRAA
jgi:exosortase/archaeosortase family protein